MPKDYEVCPICGRVNVLNYVRCSNPACGMEDERTFLAKSGMDASDCPRRHCFLRPEINHQEELGEKSPHRSSHVAYRTTHSRIDEGSLP